MGRIPESWIPRRRDDGETIGWIDLESHSPSVPPVDRPGRPLEPVADWHEAEEALDEIGLRFLMDRFRYRERTVRIRHIYDDRVIVSTALSDAVGDVGEEYALPFPIGTELTEAG